MLGFSFMIHKKTWLAKNCNFKMAQRKEIVIVPKGLKLKPRITIIKKKKKEPTSKSGATEEILIEQFIKKI